MNTKTVCCENCIYSQLIPDNNKRYLPATYNYECRITHRFMENYLTRTTYRENDDWCGEFEPRGNDNLNKAGNE